LNLEQGTYFFAPIPILFATKDRGDGFLHQGRKASRSAVGTLPSNAMLRRFDPFDGFDRLTASKPLDLPSGLASLDNAQGFRRR
jgi:hypothetical protein